jgi:hypothetical protein
MKTSVAGIWLLNRIAWVGRRSALMEITGVDEKTIRRGPEELAASLMNRPVERIRQPGGVTTCRKNAADLVGPRGVGRPRNGRQSDDRAEMGPQQLAHAVHQVGSGRPWRQLPTLARLLRNLDYSLHVNAKKIDASSNHLTVSSSSTTSRCSGPSSARPACRS